MDEILKFENRDRLYSFLIYEYGFVKLDEKYFPEAFGNFFIVLSGKEFLLRYTNDRSYLTIEIASHFDSSNWLDLSFLRNYIYSPDNINSDDSSETTSQRIEKLNRFLKTDFDLIADLLNDENHADTRQKIGKLLKQQFNEKFPGMMKG